MGMVVKKTLENKHNIAYSIYPRAETPNGEIKVSRRTSALGGKMGKAIIYYPSAKNNVANIEKNVKALAKAVEIAKRINKI